MIWMSTPPVLANAYGNCSEYKPECVGNVQKQLFYVGLSLTALGMAGQSVSHGPFMAEQSNRGCDCSYNILRCNCCCFKCSINLIGVVALLVVAFIKSWDTLFGICTIFCLVSVVVLLIRVNRYNYVGPQGSGLTTLFRVLFAASSKIFVKRPQYVNELHEISSLDASNLSPHSESLRYNLVVQFIPNYPYHFSLARFETLSAIVLENPKKNSQSVVLEIVKSFEQ